MTTSDLTPAGHPKPINWDDMGSSERDMYEDRMSRAGMRAGLRSGYRIGRTTR